MDIVFDYFLKFLKCILHFLGKVGISAVLRLFVEKIPEIVLVGVNMVSITSLGQVILVRLLE